MPGTFADASPVRLILGVLREDDRMVAALGPATPPVSMTKRIGATISAPYPFLRVITTPGGTVDHNLYGAVVECSVQAYGPEDGSVEDYVLERIVRTALVVLNELPDRDWQPWEPVVSNVDCGPPYPIDGDPGSRRYWSCVAGLSVHPPAAPETAPWLS